MWSFSLKWASRLIGCARLIVIVFWNLFLVMSVFIVCSMGGSLVHSRASFWGLVQSVSPLVGPFWMMLRWASWFSLLVPSIAMVLPCLLVLSI